jgi:uncharacterized membrane protein YbhN (UPF0104 family)
MAELKETSTTPRPRAIYWVISLSLAVVLLYFSLRGIEWLRVWSILREAKLAIVALVLLIMSSALFLRALRWRVLLSAESRVPIPLAFWATSAGYLGWARKALYPSQPRIECSKHALGPFQRDT